jgi:prepilin-type N-terminal cleavage/methylation domain-containing protein
MKRSHSKPAPGFTLIEILLASAAAALILAAIYGVFQHAIRLRDSATQRIRDLRLRARAATIIRDDLRNAYISGGLFAGIVQGDTAGTDGPNSDLPGYLKLTTTTAKDTPDALYGDVQQVEYYIVRDSGTAAAGSGGGGDLVRAVTRDLLDSDQPIAGQQRILTGVQSFQVSFYDGANWQSSWSFNTADNSTTGSTASTTSTNSSAGSSSAETLPDAIRVDIQQVPPTAGAAPPPPLEIMVPWTTQPFTSPTPTPSATPS